MPRRSLVRDLPEPERVAEPVIARCRAEIEHGLKRTVRECLIPLLRWRYRLGELGEGFHWGRGIRVARGSRIGRFAYLGKGFESHGPIVVGDLCMIAAGCKIVGADHCFDVAGEPIRLAFAPDSRPVTVFGADAWVGQRVTVIEGVRIGTGAVVGSGAIVTGDVPAYSVVAGTPARHLRWRFPEAIERRHHRAVTDGELPGPWLAA